MVENIVSKVDALHTSDDFGRFQVTGWLAWWFWLFVHIMYLVGFRNRVAVLMQWAYSYFTYQRGARLITRAEAEGPRFVDQATRRTGEHAVSA